MKFLKNANPQIKFIVLVIYVTVWNVMSSFGTMEATILTIIGIIPMLLYVWGICGLKNLFLDKEE